MTTATKAMVLASFAADSLALGAHWIYDTAEIRRKFGRVEGLIAPECRFLSPGQGSGGDFTHYGDQALVLLESVAANGTFSQEDFARAWQGVVCRLPGLCRQGHRRHSGAHAAGGCRLPSAVPNLRIFGAGPRVLRR